MIQSDTECDRHGTPGSVAFCRTLSYSVVLYIENQYDAFTRNVLSGRALKRSRTSRDASNVPGFMPSCWRPCDQTKNSVDPGRYSQRTTVFDRNSLM